MKPQQCVAAFVLASITAVAPAQTIEERIADCAGESDHQQRLACFDLLARDVASGSGRVAREKDQPSSVSPAGSVTPPGSPGHSSVEKFGLEHKDKNGDLAEELQAQVMEIYKDALGKMLLILDNGQIWQQKDTRTLIIHKGDSVLIERGFMSAFYLTANKKKRIRVARIK